MACSGFVSLFSRTAAVVAVVALAGCTTTGQFFITEALADFVPGQTTFADAVRMLGAEPSNTYAQLNGAMLARWAHKGSILTDAIYFRQEATLRFDPQGRFVGIVDTVNILIPPRDPNGQANAQSGQSLSQQSPATVQAPRQTTEVIQETQVQEVERIIIIDAAGQTSGLAPVGQGGGSPSSTGLVPATPPASQAYRPSNTLENSLPNPVVTYPVPTGRQ
ncbi:hypothetical protein [Neopusillimonas aromaticivorans]|uniref:hypothetical protein n=1 Tax=Neopusillimonas aromaticivorans TaxID=2979868 RepID=UPI002597DD66|nr:hypothetical protein [Neopusillimonas aromaticivorans]WJJ93190.1 hypothetical protein N7E01_14250 [Neopusillimonas aromaticivorans]